MGTNFFWKVPVLFTPTGQSIGFNTDDPRVHLGKRSAAGRYCWDCDVTLCVGGRLRVHSGDPFLPACPSCGEPFIAEGLTQGPAGVELGFVKANVERPKGVRGASSFSWAQDPATVRSACLEHGDERLIVDEYGREMTCREFLAMLEANCPLEFTDSIGSWFS